MRRARYLVVVVVMLASCLERRVLTLWELYSRPVRRQTARLRLWEAFPNPQQLGDQMRAEMPRWLTPEQRNLLLLSVAPPQWCVSTRRRPL
jgi:hypothetical protein